MSAESLVRNAADATQVQAARKKEHHVRTQELLDMRELLKTLAGRRFLWRLLSRCRVLESIWEGSARIHYNAGQQDIGHFIMGEITEADAGAFIMMMQENKQNEEEDNG